MKVLLKYDLVKTFALLQPLYTRIKFCQTRPIQIVIRMCGYSLLIFSSGQCRLMGRVSLSQAQHVIDSLNDIYYSVTSPLVQVSQTVVFKLDSLHLPIDLYKFVAEYKTDDKICFEPEIFPSISLHYWKPLHVNVFSTGKVIVLGCNALQSIQDIRDWLDFQLLLM